MVKVAGNGVPGAVGQGDPALLPGLEVSRVNGARQIRQRFGSGAMGNPEKSSLNTFCHQDLDILHTLHK